MDQIHVKGHLTQSELECEMFEIFTFNQINLVKIIVMPSLGPVRSRPVAQTPIISIQMALHLDVTFAVSNIAFAFDFSPV